MSRIRSRWAEIDLSAIGENVDTIRSWLPVGSGLIAVVKDNAYGHGAVEVGRVALARGAIGLAVAKLEEVSELKGLCPPPQILLLGGLLPEQAAEVAELGCSVVCHSRELIAAMAAAAPVNRRIPIHLKVNTGMNCLGCSPEVAPDLARQIANSPRLRLAGVLTHFAAPASDKKFTRSQFAAFSKLLAGLPVEAGLRHACNSTAARLYPEMALDAVRCGIAIYGDAGSSELRPALSLHSRIIQVIEVEAGATVGSLRDWRATSRARIATAAIGYGDGVHRMRSNRGQVAINGRLAPLIGGVGMDQIGIDISDLPKVKPGDVVTLIGEGITAEQVAEWSETIEREVLTSAGNRVERVYKM
ncbi:MAG: alanine racemase [Candidatus Dormibacteraceae bacterium]